MERNRTSLRDGRIVVLARGTKTQTVNVCTSANKDGEYEHVYRLPITEDVELADIAELADAAAVHDWVPTLNGLEEKKDGQGGQPVLPLVDVDVDQEWLAAATAAVEIVLDDVVIEFLEHPYLHRVEHSLHAEIYRRLKDQPALQGQFPIATGELTQVAHKEWPETFPDRSVGATQRGSFDLAVVSPQQFASASRQKFRQGRIAAPVVVEVGLDYGLKHLQADGKKMLDSHVRAPYILHLSRVGSLDVDAIEAYAVAPPGHLRVAYVHHDPSGRTRYKRLGDSAMRTK